VHNQAGVSRGAVGIDTAVFSACKLGLESLVAAHPPRQVAGDTHEEVISNSSGTRTERTHSSERFNGSALEFLVILSCNSANRILSGLSAADFAILEPQLTRVALYSGQTVHRHGDNIEHVYFVESGFLSTSTVLSCGQPLEVGLTGSEGVVGFSVVLGGRMSFAETTCQIGGQACRMSAEGLREAFAKSPTLHDLILRFILSFQVQVTQTAACNAHHPIDQRLVRWLLAAHDRSGLAPLSVTQEMIAGMLGVRRATVSVAASALQRAGIIRYQHGQLTIVDRPALENAACECYDTLSSASASVYPSGRARARSERDWGHARL
jgi:CRP-like cAMP-binding protein